MESKKITLSQKVYSHPESEEALEKFSTDLIEHSTIEGRQHGKQNKPETADEHRALIFNKIETRVQGAIDKIQQVHQPVSAVVAVNEITAKANESIKAMQAKRADKEHQHAKTVNEMSELTAHYKKPWFKRLELVISITLGLCEGFYMYEATSSASFPFISSIVIGLTVAFLSGLGVHIAAGHIRNSATILQKRWRRLKVLTIALVFSISLGLIRSYLYEDNIDLTPGADNSIHINSILVSGWALALISFFAFLLALEFAIKHWRSPEEIQLELDIIEKQNGVQKIESEISEIETRIASIESDTILESTLAIAKYEYFIASERRLINTAKEAHEVYIENDLRHRNDGLCPAFFSNPPEFKFKLFLDNIKHGKDE